MPWNGNLTNEDGLIVEFGNDRGIAVADGKTAEAPGKMLTMYIDSQDLVALADSAREDVAYLPAGAMVTNSVFVAETAWTGTGTMTIGLANSAGTAIDADGIDAAIDVDAALAAAGDAVTNDGALVDGTEVIGSDAWVYATVSGTVSAGTGTLYISYIMTNQT